MVAVSNVRVPASVPPTLRGIERAIARLPAEGRAKLAWAVPTIRAALRGFHDSPRAPADLTTVTRAMLEPVIAVGEVAPADWNLEMLGVLADLPEDLVAVRRITDATVADTAEWALRTWLAAVRVFGDLAHASRPPETMSAPPLTAAQLDAMATDEALPFRLEALLVALFDASARGDANLTTALADDAFDAAYRLVCALRRHDIAIDPFAGEASADRAARALRYGEQMREAFSPEDMRVITEARMGAWRCNT